jgi:Kef-type K+ transport system membrane component KefB
VRGKIEDVATLFLLPLFFASTGLHTDLGLLADGKAWGMAGMITVVATIGKVGGTLLAARWTGLEARECAALGVLMNTRGLMELIILNVGLEVGAIDGKVFSMMVVMTLVTTLITAPVVRRLTKTTT